MKPIPSALQAHLDTGTTTLCWCWRIIRQDAQTFGFTDHDQDLTFIDTTFQAATGMTASELSQSVGLNVDNLEAESALTSDLLSEVDLAAGLYDDARVEIYRVNWQDVEQRVLMQVGSIGEVKRGDHHFSAEVRGVSHYLNQEKGRLYQYACDADLGDARCGVDLDLPAYRGVGSVSEVLNGRQFQVSDLGTFSTGWFTRGRLTWTDGANAGHVREVRRHVANESGVTIELWQSTGEEIAVGDAFVVTAGCNKRLGVCKNKFGNAINFRGFPLMPGNDVVTAYPKRGNG